MAKVKSNNLRPDLGDLARIERERKHYDEYYSLHGNCDDSLVLDPADMRRYVSPSAKTIFPREYHFHLLNDLKGKKVLEIGCGIGRSACMMAELGATVYAYDISRAAVDIAKRRVAANRLQSRVHLEVADDVSAAFSGQTFDILSAIAVFHHMPLADLGRKMHARLKAGGRVVYSEPVRNSKVLAAARRLVPWRESEITEDEVPLDDTKLHELGAPFDSTVRREFECFSRIKPLIRAYRPLVITVCWTDSVLFSLPGTRRFATYVVGAFYK